jgi:hypothetical protein
LLSIYGCHLPSEEILFIGIFHVSNLSDVVHFDVAFASADGALCM